jgi:phage terminase large subunit
MARLSHTFCKLAEALNERPRYIDSRGGARSGKTVAAMQLFSILCLEDKTPTITSVVSENLPHLKRGAVRDFKFALVDMGRWDENAWNKSECIYTFPSGSIIEFFGADTPAKLQGPARDRLLINEANRVEWEAARQLMVRTSGLVMYDYNPSAPFWGTEEIPKRDRYALVHSTYRNNQYLPDEVRREIEANRGTGNWWRVYGEGLIGQIEGQIFDFKIVNDMPDPAGFIETRGMDFGFTNDPTTIIRCLVHTGRREIYADQLIWQTGMTNPDIAHALKDLGIKRQGNGPCVWADSAEPKSITEVAGYGLNVKGCDKKTAVREQIQALQPWTIYVTRRSVDLINEGRKYLFKQRTDGTFTNEPIDFFNHGIDALRYACYSGVILGQGKGRYNISIRGGR